MLPSLKPPFLDKTSLGELNGSELLPKRSFCLERAGSLAKQDRGGGVHPYPHPRAVSRGHPHEPGGSCWPEQSEGEERSEAQRTKGSSACRRRATSILG